MPPNPYPPHPPPPHTHPDAQVLLSVDTSNGARTYYASSTSSKVEGSSSASALTFTLTPGPVVADDIYLGETYDARLEQPGFSSCSFGNGTAWAPAVAVPTQANAGVLGIAQ
jgi:hypothetical protein